MSERQKVEVEQSAPQTPSEAIDSLDRKRSRRRWLSVSAGLVAAAVLAAVVLSGGADDANGAEKTGEKADEKAPVPVEVIAAREGAIAAYVSATANLVAENDVTVLAEIDGRVTALNVDEGQRVGRGQVLARLDPSDEEIALKKAQLRHANAKSVYERGRDLMDKDLISREEHDRLTVDFQVSSQEMAEAEWALAQTVVRAPFSGRVTARHIQRGQHLRQGDQLFQITDFDPLIARIYLSETDIVGLEPGTAVRIMLNANPDFELEAKIRQISPVVDTATGTVKVTIEANAPPPEVRPGSFVSIHVVRETHAEALLVPREAILRELQASHVFVTDGETVSKRTVTVGLEESGDVEILEGLDQGEQVVIAGQGGLREGAEIRILGAEGESSTQAETQAPADPTEAG